MSDHLAHARNPERIDFGTRIVEGGFFVRKDPVPARTAFVAPAGDTEAGIRHCLTYTAGRSTIRDELIDMIGRAERKVFVAALFLGDEQVRIALERAAQRLEGGIYVVAALDDRGLDKAINETTDTMDINRQTELQNFTSLTNAGIYVRGYPGLHAKFVVVDDTIALVSSANLVTRAFDVTSENGVVITGGVEVKALAWMFRRLWRQSRWDMPPDPHHAVRDRAAEDIDLPATLDTGRLIWTWEDQHRILDAVRQTIDGATRELILATFGIGSMTYGTSRQPARPELIFDPLRAAVERGVRVRLLLRGRNNVPASRAEALAFHNAGVEISADRLHHAKGCIADGNSGAIFSANFMTSMGLTGGVEVGARLEGTPVLQQALNYFKHCIDESDLQFVIGPTSQTLSTRLLAESLQPWPMAARATLTCDDTTWNQLATHAGPALFEVDNANAVKIVSGSRCWTLEGSDSDWHVRPTGFPKGARDSSRLLDSWLSSRHAPGETRRPKRGLLAAIVDRAP
jgi:phosphatidylserine/phosphatidylglycerophosphate/cardiolipin synthase-like enzyme